MSKLKLPIWFITERSLGTIMGDVCGSYAFTDADDVMKFMVERSPARWDVVHATSREALIMVIADVHQCGATFICLNSEPDGSGGERILLTDLIAI
jgi:hypothetical protein